MVDLSKFVGFEWDEGNDTKNWKKHNVNNEECQEVFFNQPLLVFYDDSHSEIEERYYILGRTNSARELFVVFTVRGALIRVSSARDQTRAERLGTMKKANRKRKVLPSFESESAERNFWLVHDSADYFDLGKARRAVFPNLKPTTRTISLRIPETLLAEIKVLANRRDVPYQSLMKIFLAERVTRERKK